MADDISGWEKFWRSLTFGRVVTLVALVLLAMLVYGIATQGAKPLLDQFHDWFNQAAEVNFVRGVITVVFVLATVAIAVSLVIFALFVRPKDDADKECFKDRLSGGKEVLAIFVGILGTIMGFYYGNTNKVTPEDVKTIQQGVSQETAAGNATKVLETKSFDLLLKKNYDDSVKAFDLLSKATPPSQYPQDIDFIMKFLADPKNNAGFKSEDDNAKNTVWNDLYCQISTKKMAESMSKETRDKLTAACSPTKPAAPSPTK